MKLLLICLLMWSAVFAGGVGKIAGSVVDENGNGVIGAAVQIIETLQGVQVLNPDGSYVFLGVEPGTYSLQFSSIGYGTKEVREVEVSSSLTSTVNITLQDEAIQIGQVVIITQKKKIDADVVVRRGPPMRCGWGRPVLPSKFLIEPRHRHYLTQPSGRDCF